MSLKTDRVLHDLLELRELTEDSVGAQRVAWTPTWAKARNWMREKLGELPVEVETDSAGNVWATLAGDSQDALLIGGHIDSVPAGGWLDGSLNLLAGLGVLRRIAAEGTPPVTLRLVDFADEEGARFGRTCFGSGSVSGSVKPRDVRGLQDTDGVTLSQAVAEFGLDIDHINEANAQLSSARAYLELHIEQGPELERLGLPVGVVTATAGVERHRLEFIGEQAHAGSTPMQTRRDAFVAAARVAVAVCEAARNADGVGTTGTLRLTPGLITAVPGWCELGVDMRHLDRTKLAQMLEHVQRVADSMSDDQGVDVNWETLWQIEPIPFDEALVELAVDAVQSVAGDAPLLGSGALHDAAEVAKAGIPTVMLFAQSINGISHSPAEDTRPEDIVASVEALDRLTSATMDRIAALDG